jgi:hypothetical protein
MFAASTSLAQTKEETIAWLQEKLSVAVHAKPDYKITDFSINECEMIFYIGTLKGGYYNFDKRYTLYYPLKGLSIGSITFQLDYDGLKIVNTYYSNWDGTSKGLLEADQYGPWTIDIQISETEPNLFERIIKAINHLSTFCVEEEEPF